MTTKYFFFVVNVFFVFLGLGFFSLGFCGDLSKNVFELQNQNDLDKNFSSYFSSFPYSEYKFVHIPSANACFYIDKIYGSESDCVKSVLVHGDPWEPHIDELIKNISKFF